MYLFEGNEIINIKIVSTPMYIVIYYVVYVLEPRPSIFPPVFFSFGSILFTVIFNETEDIIK